MFCAVHDNIRRIILFDRVLLIDISFFTLLLFYYSHQFNVLLFLIGKNSISINFKSKLKSKFSIH